MKSEVDRENGDSLSLTPYLTHHRLMANVQGVPYLVDRDSTAGPIGFYEPFGGPAVNKVNRQFHPKRLDKIFTADLLIWCMDVRIAAYLVAEYQAHRNDREFLDEVPWMSDATMIYEMALAAVEAYNSHDGVDKVPFALTVGRVVHDLFALYAQYCQ